MTFMTKKTGILVIDLFCVIHYKIFFSTPVHRQTKYVLMMTNNFQWHDSRGNVFTALACQLSHVVRMLNYFLNLLFYSCFID